MLYAGLLLMPLGMIGVVRMNRRRFTALALLVIGVSFLWLAACGGGGGGGGGPKSDNTLSLSPPGPFETGVEYFWKVEADDGRGGITTSEIWSFTAQ